MVLIGRTKIKQQIKIPYIFAVNGNKIVRKERLVTINNNKILDDMSSDSDEMEDVTSLTSHTTPVKIFKSPSSGRPKPVFLPEPKSFSTKKVRTLVIYYFLEFLAHL